MIDQEGINGTVKVLISKASEFCSAPFLTSKVKWDIQVRGSYNLAFPLAHTDFPTREETQEYVANRIEDALRNHNNTNRHNGAYATPGINLPIIATTIVKDPLESVFMSTRVNKDESGDTMKIDIKSASTKGNSLFGSIGYGV